MTDRPIKIYDSLGVKAINIKDRDIKRFQNKNKSLQNMNCKQITAKLIVTLN